MKPLLFLLPAIAAVLVVPAVVDASHLNTVILVLMAAQLGVSWNLVGGYAGQVSLGHAAFYGLGAYTSTVLLINFGLNPWLGVLAGGVVAVLLSLAFGWSCFRLKGHYFAMATIAVAELVQIFFTEWEYGGAAVGLYVPMDKQGWLWMNFATKLPYYWLALGLLLLTLAANWWIERSYLGYYFRAIKDEPDAARSIGINIARYKQVALSVSAFFTALGGSLYAQKELYIDPNSVLSTALSVKMALVAILGGVGTLFGPVVGAVILTSIEEFSRILFGGSGRGTDVIIYASLIIGVAVFYPTGILGWWTARKERRAARADASRQMAAHAASASKEAA
ncbi:branched-chain amino acid ABC transporter permease [Rhodoferax saidenbachensis]|uniref:Branched-chain amino acid transport system permease protein n=1 Tax=Rhodoferax saidenbachensis TaxID=1484693 RepID=A0ABU1ZPL8_9BURK|nr:branched-chain amino acid ABC transporter permease [Rhodoferax saidenbachensis]MDR7307485.1 branched-chain amino acid transport system permease protein [Rhodoferax saidenbachensis]